MIYASLKLAKKNSDKLFGGKIIPLKYIVERTAVTVIHKGKVIIQNVFVKKR